MELMLRVAGVAIAALVILLVLRGISNTFTVFVKIAALLFLLGFFIVELAEGVSAVRELVSEFIAPESFVGISVSAMIKALGIALVGRISSDICRECGENGLAQGVESVAGIVIFSLSLPILSQILNFASDLLQRGS